jgi:hypothetical protein
VLANKVKKIEISGKKGNNFYIPDVSALTINDKAANTQVTLSSPTETKFTLTVNKHKEISWVEEDILEIQAQYSLRTEYTKGAGYEIAKQIDADLFALYSGLTQSVATGGATLDEANFLAAMEKLDLADIDDSDRCLIVRPTQKTALFKIDSFIRSDVRGDGKSVAAAEMVPMKKEKIGTWFGADVYCTNQVPLSTTYKNLLIQKEAFALGVQKTPRVQSQYKQEYLGWLTTVDVIYGVAEYRDLAGVVVTTSS